MHFETFRRDAAAARTGSACRREEARKRTLVSWRSKSGPSTSLTLPPAAETLKSDPSRPGRRDRSPRAPAAAARIRCIAQHLREPPASATFFSLPSAKNAIDRLSGDQNGPDALSVPGSGRAASDVSSRIHKPREPLESTATNASALPSGEITNASVWSGRRVSGGAVTMKRIEVRSTSCRDIRPSVQPAASSAIASSPAAASQISRGRRADAAGVAVGSRSGAPAMTSSSSMRASPASRNRKVGSLRRQRRMSATRRRGVAAGNAVQSGSVFRIAASVSETDSPSNVCRPVSIS